MQPTYRQRIDFLLVFLFIAFFRVSNVVVAGITTQERGPSHSLDFQLQRVALSLSLSLTLAFSIPPAPHRCALCLQDRIGLLSQQRGGHAQQMVHVSIGGPSNQNRGMEYRYGSVQLPAHVCVPPRERKQQSKGHGYKYP